MGKALPTIANFQPDALGAHAPRSFRAGITTPDQGLLGSVAQPEFASESTHPLRSGAAAALEDAFWRDAYTHEGYYVMGRGYDQYRPAYALGWQAAFDYAESSEFAQVESLLERHWESHDTGSLLDWADVRLAVHAAWKRGKAALAEQSRVVSSKKAQLLLQPLQLKQRQFVKNLGVLMLRADPPPSDFMWQVLDRHKSLVQALCEELEDQRAAKRDGISGILHFVGASFMHGWLRLQTAIGGTDSAKVMHYCATTEKLLLMHYQELQSQPLSPELQGLLARQVHLLQLNHDKLLWVQHNWEDV